MGWMQSRSRKREALGASHASSMPAVFLPGALLQATAVYRDMLKAFRFGIVADNGQLWLAADARFIKNMKVSKPESFRSMIQGMLEKAGGDDSPGDARLHADNVVRDDHQRRALTLKGNNTGIQQRFQPQFRMSPESISAAGYDQAVVFCGWMTGILTV
ncbi:MAG: hypothetical protein ACLT76_01525 [Clostridium fessum]